MPGSMSQPGSLPGSMSRSVSRSVPGSVPPVSLRRAPRTHLCGVTHELQRGVAGDHRAQVGQGAGPVQPPPRAVRPRRVHELDHCGDSGGSAAAPGSATAAPGIPGVPDLRSLAKAALITHWMNTRVSAYLNFSCFAPSP